MGDTAAVQEEIINLKEKIQSKEWYPQAQWGSMDNASSGPREVSEKPSRKLKGHFGKVYALHWAQNEQADAQNQHALVSASQDGKLIIWNAFTTNKFQAIPLRSSWVMTCAYEPTKGLYVACGGLDNLCSVYKVDSDAVTAGNNRDNYCELVKHDGYLSCCRFIDDRKIITSSGDATCILWDIDASGKRDELHFTDHTGDCMSVAICPTDKHVFASGSCDSTAKIWDTRMGNGEGSNSASSGNCVMSFGEKRFITGGNDDLPHAHESDINSVCFLADGKSIGTGSDDSSCKVFDLRSYGILNNFQHEVILHGITSVCTSKTGRFFIAGYDDYHLRVFDTLKELSPESTTSAFQQVPVHENRVSSVGMAPSGKALCTGSWDTLLHVHCPRQ